MSDDKLWTMLERYVDKTREHKNFENIDTTVKSKMNIKTLRAYNIK